MLSSARRDTVQRHGVPGTATSEAMGASRLQTNRLPGARIARASFVIDFPPVSGLPAGLRSGFHQAGHILQSCQTLLVDRGASGAQIGAAQVGDAPQQFDRWVRNAGVTISFQYMRLFAVLAGLRTQAASRAACIAESCAGFGPRRRMDLMETACRRGLRLPLSG